MWLLVIGIIYLGIHLVPVFVTDVRLWGFDSWVYLPQYASFLLFAFGAFIFIPDLQEWIFKIWDKLSKILAKVPTFVWIILAGALFFLLGQKTFFLGDGYLRIRNLEQGLFLSPAEPLDTLVRYWFYALLKPVFHFTSAEAYSWVSVLSGVGMLTGLAYYLKKLFPDKAGDRWFFALALVSAGFIQIFYGYVESYSLVIAFGILFFVSSLSMAKESKFSIMPAVFYSLAVCFHPMALIFFPSFIYIYYKVISKSDGKIWKWLLSMAVLPVSFGIVLLVFHLNGITPEAFFGLLAGENRFLPLINESRNYGIISLNHLIDFVNLLLLTAPAIIVLPLVFGKSYRSKGNPNKLFLLLSVITGLLYAFTINPVLGYSRDWDMFAVAAFPITITLVYFIIEKHIDNLKYIAFPLVFISLLHTIPWLLLNNNDSSSLRRAEQLAETPYWSDHAKASLFDELKSYYFATGDDKKTTDFATKAFKEKPSERYMLSLARQKINTGSIDEALSLLTELSQTNYMRNEVTFLLGTLYFNLNDLVNAGTFLREAASLDPQNYDAFYYLGQVYMKTGKTGPATDQFKIAIRINSNRLEAYTALGGIYYDIGNIDDAMSIFRKTYMMAPTDPGVNYNLSLCYAVTGDNQSAMKHLKKAEEYGFDKSAVAALRNELSKK